MSVTHILCLWNSAILEPSSCSSTGPTHSLFVLLALQSQRLSCSATSFNHFPLTVMVPSLFWDIIRTPLHHALVPVSLPTLHSSLQHPFPPDSTWLVLLPLVNSHPDWGTSCLVGLGSYSHIPASLLRMCSPRSPGSVPPHRLLPLLPLCV